MKGSGAAWQEQRVLPRDTRSPRQADGGDEPARNGNGNGRPAPPSGPRNGLPGGAGGGGGGKPGGGKPGGGKPGGGKPGGGQAKLAEVARGSTLNLVGAGVSALTTVGVTVFVTREFSPTVAGAFFTATSAFLIVEAVASLGANVGLVYFIARLRSLGEEKRIPAILRAAIIPVVVASVLLTVVMVLLATPLAHVLLSGHLAKKGAVSVPSVAEALRALAFTLPFAALLDTFLGMGRGYRDMRPTVVIDKIGRSAAQMLGVLVAAAGGSVALLAPLWSLPYVPAAAFAWFWVRRIRRRPPSKSRNWMPDVPPELAALLALSTPVPSLSAKKAQRVGSRAQKRRLANANPRGFWQFTTPRAVASLASITLQRIDIVLVAILIDPKAAAVYTAATRFLVAGQLGNTAISMAAQPRFTELFALGDRRNANVVYQVTTAWLVLLTWPMYWLSIAYGPEVLSVFGHAYTAGSAVMVILGVSMLVATACGQVDMVLITTGRSSWSLFNGLLAVFVNIGLDLWLIPRYQITGAAIGWAVAITVTNVMPLTQLAAFIKLQPFGRGTIMSAGLSTLCFGGVPFGTRLLLGPGFGSLGIGVAAGSVVFALGLWRLQDALQLSAMPGISVLLRRVKRRGGGR